MFHGNFPQLSNPKDPRSCQAHVLESCLKLLLASFCSKKKTSAKKTCSILVFCWGSVSWATRFVISALHLLCFHLIETILHFNASGLCRVSGGVGKSEHLVLMGKSGTLSKEVAFFSQ